MSLSSSSSCDLLILGAGWTYGFLQAELAKRTPAISHVATTRDGRNGTIKWAWDQEARGSAQYEALPRAKTVCVTFPIKGAGGSRAMVEGYEGVHGEVRWIQLGSSGIWDGGPTLQASDEKKPGFKWTTRHSPYAVDNPRVVAEDELLSLRANAFVLNLCGLWGGTRDPINWVPRIAATKEALASKTSIHLIHGTDVARAILAVSLAPAPLASSPPAARLPIGAPTKQLGQRYLLTDLRVYDWWDLVSAWGASTSPPPTPSSISTPSFSLALHPIWVLELMDEHSVRALPRTPEQLGRALDSRDFWRDFKLMPVKGRLERGRL